MRPLLGLFVSFLLAATGRAQSVSGTGGSAVFDLPGQYDWPKPPGMMSVCVVVVGAGGAGSGNGHSGGRGDAVRDCIPLPDSVATVHVIVGEGGNASNGGNGGDSSFGPYLKAYGGGSGGENLRGGGAGGSGFIAVWPP